MLHWEKYVTTSKKKSNSQINENFSNCFAADLCSVLWGEAVFIRQLQSCSCKYTCYKAQGAPASQGSMLVTQHGSPDSETHHHTELLTI